MAACGGGSTARSVLDGSPRRPGAQGVVTAVSLESVTLAGQPARQVRGDLQAFRALDGAPQALLGVKGHFVQLGLRGGKVAWLGTFGVPGGSPPRVSYTGTVASTGTGEVVFRGGVVLRAPGGITSQLHIGRRVEAHVDPVTGEVADALEF